MPDISSPPTLLIVDDVPENLAVLGGLLQHSYRVQVANSGKRALSIAARNPRPDLILLDVMMPEMDGYTVLSELQQNPQTRDIPVIFVTALDADEDEERGLGLGAVDYIAKPIRPAIVMARVKAQLELKRARDQLSNQNAWLENEIARRMQENVLMQDVSIRALASLAEIRDMETGHHILRTQAYVGILAAELRGHPRFAPHMSEAMAQLITKAAPLHDIGKVGIPDNILLKPGRLTPEEFEIMKRHASLGGEAITRAMQTHSSEEDIQFLGKQFAVSGMAADHETRGPEHAPLAFLAVAKEIAQGHHEKWDGSGYPLGLVGDAIPIPARIMAVADVFDALASRRIYKPALSVDASVEIIKDGRGKHFDPDIVDAFLANLDAFVDVLHRLQDTDESLDHKLHAMRTQGML